MGIASLRSPFGQPAAGYLRFATIPARRSACGERHSLRTFSQSGGLAEAVVEDDALSPPNTPNLRPECCVHRRMGVATARPSISVAANATACERPRSRAVWRRRWWKMMHSRRQTHPTYGRSATLPLHKPAQTVFNGAHLIAGSADVHIGSGERPCSIAAETSSLATRRLPVWRSRPQSR